MPIPPRQFGHFEPTEFQLRNILGLGLLWLIVYGLIVLHGVQLRRRGVQTAGASSVQIPYRDVVLLKRARLSEQ